MSSHPLLLLGELEDCFEKLPFRIEIPDSTLKSGKREHATSRIFTNGFFSHFLRALEPSRAAGILYFLIQYLKDFFLMCI